MSNTNGLDIYGTEIKGNLTIQSDNCNSNGNGSVELAGTLYTDYILKYSTAESGVNIEQIILDSGTLLIPSTIPGTSNTSASLIVSGGIFVKNNSKFLGQILICNTTNNLNTTDTNGALIISGGVLIKQNLNIGTSGVLTLNNNISSLNVSSGALISYGGISIINTTDATSFTSGGDLTIAGGASIAKTLFANLLNTNNATISNILSVNLNTFNLNSTNGIFVYSTIENLSTTNLTSSNIISINNTLSNLYTINEIIESSTIQNLNVTTTNILSETVGSSNISSANIINLNITTGNFNTITVGNLFVTNELIYNDIVSNLSSANTISQSSTISNLNVTNTTFSNLYGNDGSNTSTLFVNYISTSNLQVSNLYTVSIATINNLIVTKGTISNLISNNSTISNLINVNLNNINITTTNLISSYATIDSLISTNITSTNLYSQMSIFNYSTISNLFINSTVPSYNPTTSSLIVSGGIYINETKNAVSITTGGGLTVLGGVGIVGDIFIGGTINASSITTSNVYISNELYSPFGSFTKITSNSLLLLNTCNSYLATGGALISYGGITINNTADAVACSYGGALTVAGGASINKTLMVCGTINSQSISVGNIYISNSLSSGNLSVININGQNITTNSLLSSLATIGNLNSILINTSNFTNTSANILNLNTNNLTSNNSILTNVSYATLIGNYLSANYITNAITLTSANATIGSLNTNDATFDNINFNDATFGSLFGSYIESYTGTINTLLSVNATTSNLYAPTSTLGNVLATNICTGTLNTTFANISIGTIGSLLVTNLITTNLTISNPNVTFLTAGSINASGATISNALIDFLTTLYASFGSLVSSNGSFSNISTGSFITINSTTSNAYITNSTITNIYNIDLNSLYASFGNLYSTNGSFYNISSNNLIVNFDLVTNSSISNSTITNIVNNYSTISNLYLTNGTFSTLIGTDIYSNNSTFTNSIITNLTNNNLVNTNATIQTVNISNLTAGNINFTGTLYQNGAPYIASQWINITPSVIVYTLGNVGIGTSSPQTTLDINGTLNVSQFATISNLYTNYATISNLITGNIYSIFGNLVNIYNTNITTTNLLGTNSTFTNSNITNVFSSNANFTNLTVANLISDITQFIGTSPSYNLTTASVILESGGLSINTTVNATSASSGGGITIAGGLALYQDAYIGGNIYLNGSAGGIITNATGPNNPLDLANKWYVDQRFTNFTVGNVNGNFTQGQVVVATTAGNIIGYPTFTFNSYDNSLTLFGTVDATSLTDGGTLTIFGGASIDQQLYVGSNAYILGVLDVNNQKITSVATPTTPYDVANKYYVDQRFSQFTIGNVFGNFTQGQVIIASTGGNITGYPTFTFDNTGLLSILTTTNALGYGSGGSLNIGGGISIGGNVYLNGSGGIITNVTAPSNNLDVANKWYVDQHTFGNVSGNFTQGQVIIANTGGNISSYPTFIFDNLTGLVSILSTTNALGYGSGGSLDILGGVSIGGNIYLNGGIITNVTGPSNLLDVANKWYVDQHTYGNVNGNFTQGQVIIATTGGNITSYPTFLFDGSLLQILSTTNSLGLGSGGSLIVLGGASIAQILYTNGLDNNNQKITSVALPINPSDGVNKAYVDYFLGISNADIRETSFILSNNVNSPLDVTGFLFDNTICSSFEAIVYLQIPTLNIYSQWEIHGVLKGSNWVINTTFIGDHPSHVNFSINTIGGFGQIQYTNTNSSGVAILRFRASTTGQGTYINITSGNTLVRPVIDGGTGQSFFTSGTILFGDGMNPILTSQNFVYTTGSLNLTNTVLNMNNSLIINVTAPNSNLQVANKWYVDQQLSSAGSFNSNGPVNFYNTLDATSVTYGGALTIFGGTSIAKSFYVGGIAHFVNTTLSTNTSTGAVIISGGLGVSGSINGINGIFTNETITNSLIINATIGSEYVTNLTASNLNSNSGIFLNLSTTNFTSTNNIFTNITTSNILSTNFTLGNGIISNVTTSNLSSTNIQTTNLTTSNIINTNISSLNITSTNLLTTNITVSNSNVTFLTVGNEIATNISTTNFSSNSGIITTLTVGNEFVTNETIVNLLATSITGVNGVFTNISTGTLNTINLNLVNLTSTNALITSLTAGNEFVTNETIINLLATNTNTTTFTSGNAVIQNNITSKNILITGNTNALNILTIDCFNSTTLGGQILFKNSSGTGDFRITGDGDGGDVQWCGGGGRSMQFGAYHQVVISGGRQLSTTLAQFNGNNATYNTIIQNTNNSIALQVRSGVTATQTANLQEWNNSTGSIILSRVNNIGEIGINSTKDYTNATSGSLTTLGGVGIAKSLYVSNINITPSQGDLFFERSFTATNNVFVPTNVTGFAFTNATVRYFKAWASVTITATTNLIAGFELFGIQAASGWKLSSTFVGDITGVVFSITSSGQIQYTSTNPVGFISSIIKFRALTTTV